MLEEPLHTHHFVAEQHHIPSPVMVQPDIHWAACAEVVTTHTVAVAPQSVAALLEHTQGSENKELLQLGHGMQAFVEVGD